MQKSFGWLFCKNRSFPKEEGYFSILRHVYLESLLFEQMPVDRMPSLKEFSHNIEAKME